MNSRRLSYRQLLGGCHSSAPWELTLTTPFPRPWLGWVMSDKSNLCMYVEVRVGGTQTCLQKWAIKHEPPSGSNICIVRVIDGILKVYPNHYSKFATKSMPGLSHQSCFALFDAAWFVKTIIEAAIPFMAFIIIASYWILRASWKHYARGECHHGLLVEFLPTWMFESLIVINYTGPRPTIHLITLTPCIILCYDSLLIISCLY